MEKKELQRKNLCATNAMLKRKNAGKCVYRV